ncbi:MAG: hypothetical protein JWN15_3657, partial [Firmicutes bacterium]|nr:hypothetical protein [Bacillota bacterium]
MTTRAANAAAANGSASSNPLGPAYNGTASGIIAPGNPLTGSGTPYDLSGLLPGPTLTDLAGAAGSPGIQALSNLPTNLPPGIDLTRALDGVTGKVPLTGIIGSLLDIQYNDPAPMYGGRTGARPGEPALSQLGFIRPIKSTVDSFWQTDVGPGVYGFKFHFNPAEIQTAASTNWQAAAQPLFNDDST